MYIYIKLILVFFLFITVHCYARVISDVLTHTKWFFTDEDGRGKKKRHTSNKENWIQIEWFWLTEKYNENNFFFGRQQRRAKQSQLCLKWSGNDFVHSLPATNFKIGIQVGIHRDRCSRKFDFIILSEALSWRYWVWIPMPIISNDLHAIGTHFSSSLASKSRMHDFFFESQISRTKQWKDVFLVLIKMQNDRPYMADRLTIYESHNA